MKKNKKLSPELGTAKLWICVPKALHESLRLEAAKRRLSTSALIREKLSGQPVISKPYDLKSRVREYLLAQDGKWELKRMLQRRFHLTKEQLKDVIQEAGLAEYAAHGTKKKRCVTFEELRP